MAIDSAAIQFLTGCKNSGIDFTSTLTLGRQQFFPSVQATTAAFLSLGINPGDIPLKEITIDEIKYAEWFFELLGAKIIESLDYNQYELCSFCRDMNFPIDWKYLGMVPGIQYSVVYDGGTLEHVFNFPQAIKNAMQMVKVGGHFLMQSPSNNYNGHGFYQFSPELIYRVFSEANGFKVEACLLFEGNSVWTKVYDPKDVLSRVEPKTNTPTYIFTVAKKLEEVEIFKTWPMQSDYEMLWDNKGVPPTVMGTAWGRPLSENQVLKGMW